MCASVNFGQLFHSVVFTVVLMVLSDPGVTLDGGEMRTQTDLTQVKKFELCLGF